MLLIIALVGSAWTDRVSICTLIAISIFIMLWDLEFEKSESLALFIGFLFYLVSPLIRIFMSKTRERREFEHSGGYVVSVVTYLESPGEYAVVKASFKNPLGITDTFAVKVEPDVPILIAVPFSCSRFTILVSENPSKALVKKYRNLVFVDSLSDLESAGDNNLLRQQYDTYHRYWINNTLS